MHAEKYLACVEFSVTKKRKENCLKGTQEKIFQLFFGHKRPKNVFYFLSFGNLLGEKHICILYVGNRERCFLFVCVCSYF